MPPPARTATEGDDAYRLGPSWLRMVTGFGSRRQVPETTQAFASEIVTPPAALPVTVADAQEYARADSDDAIFLSADCRRYAGNGAVGIYGEGIVAQRRRLVVDCTTRPQAGTGTNNFHCEPDPLDGSGRRPRQYRQRSTTSNLLTRLAQPSVSDAWLKVWPGPQRETAAYALTYDCGWLVNSTYPRQSST